MSHLFLPSDWDLAGSFFWLWGGEGDGNVVQMQEHGDLLLIDLHWPWRGGGKSSETGICWECFEGYLLRTYSALTFL